VIRIALLLALVAYVPGALLFRSPVADRRRRAALPAEERAFWAVMLSVALSSCVTMALGAAGFYSFERLLWANGLVSASLVLAGNVRLRLDGAPRPTLNVLRPLVILGVGSYFTFLVPPAEYVMGGRDPGVYVNEGVQLAQRGRLTIRDDDAAVVPPLYRDLFFPAREAPDEYTTRFMGFFLLDRLGGDVVGQFPHLYPSWMAIGYGINGLSGVRWTASFFGLLGLASVYFAGARLFGRPAAIAGAGLLAIHVVQIWYGRYPNAEIVVQPLVFACLLAYVHASSDDDWFFAPVAALLALLTLFAHISGLFVITAIVATAVLGRFGGQPIRWSFGIPLVLGSVVGALYFVSYLSPYLVTPTRFLFALSSLQILLLVLAAAGGAALLWAANRPAPARVIREWSPVVLVVAVLVLAAYAYFVRRTGGLLAPHDADSLRTFTAYYLTPLGLVAALLGFVVAARRSFWTAAPFLILFTVFSAFFFYKIRIVPEHFWAARRFVAVILPGALLLVGAAAFADLRVGGSPAAAFDERRLRWVRAAAGILTVGWLAWHFVGASKPILRHVEYAGLIPKLESLAGRFGDNDLVLVESRGASDVHVMALPLAYIYARHVLVFDTTNPDPQLFRAFLDWARERYDRVFFVGGGGTALLSRSMDVAALGGERFQVPEYELALNAYPQGVRFKEFDFSVYEFTGQTPALNGFDVDVGAMDDLYVRRFHAKEQRADGFTFRWTRDASYVSIVGTDARHRRLTIWMGSGGRPAQAGPADVRLTLNDRVLGQVTVGPGVAPFEFDVPVDLAEAIAQSDAAAQLRIETTAWVPAAVAGGRDTRDLGVVVDRIRLE